MDEEEQIEDEKMELTSPESNGSFEQKSEESPIPELKVVIEQNGSGDSNADEIEGVPKTPSTAERRKVILICFLLFKLTKTNVKIYFFKDVR